MLPVPQILISAGEASGDRYAAWLVEKIRARAPETRFFGCAGEHLRDAGCEGVVRAEDLATVGLREVIGDIPRIYGEFRRLLAEAARRKPDLAVLVDAPDFNLRVAGRLKKLGVPVLYLVAPQAWAWRPWRTRQIARLVERLFCIFPFEERWFRERGVNAEYIGHPLAGRVRPSLTRAEFIDRWKLPQGRPLVALLPGSRRREIALNLPPMLEAARKLDAQCYIVSQTEGLAAATEVPTVTGDTWNALAHADSAIVASGTVTVEAALLGTPMVVVYRVTEPTWRLGRLLVRTPFYSMVNLVAGRMVVPELIQDDFVPARVVEETRRLLGSPADRSAVREGLSEVADKLRTQNDPLDRAAARVVERLATPSAMARISA